MISVDECGMGDETQMSEILCIIVQNGLINHVFLARVNSVVSRRFNIMLGDR